MGDALVADAEKNCLYCVLNTGGLCVSDIALNASDRPPGHLLNQQKLVAQVLELKPGAIIRSTNDKSDTFHIIRSGWVGIFAYRLDGSRQMLRLAMPGDTFRLPRARGTSPPYTAEALTAASCCLQSADDVHWMRSTNTQYAERYIAKLEWELATAHCHMTNLGRRDAMAQIAQFLTSLSMLTTGNNVLVTLESCKIPLTQRQLGEALGLTQIHVNRTIRRLRCEEILTFQDGIFTVLDASRIAEIIDLTPDKQSLWLRHANPVIYGGNAWG